MDGGAEVSKLRRVILWATSTSLVLHLVLSPLAYQNKAMAHNQVYDQTISSFTFRPDLPLKRYANGQIGIAVGDYARAYQIVAYRYLSGKPLTSGEQAEYLALWHRRWQLPTSDYMACTLSTKKGR